MAEYGGIMEHPNKLRREALGLAQRDVAKAIGVKKQAINKWELGKSTPLECNAAKWDRALDALESKYQPLARRVEENKRRREVLGLSAGEMAKLIGVARRRVTNWEAGVDRPGWDKLAKWDRALDALESKYQPLARRVTENRQRRKALGLTADEIAKLVGSSGASVTQWERGGYRPSWGRLAEWGGVLDALESKYQPLVLRVAEARRRREAMSLSQECISRYIGVGVTQISRWERSVAKISWGRMGELEAVLDELEAKQGDGKMDVKGNDETAGVGARWHAGEWLDPRQTAIVTGVPREDLRRYEGAIAGVVDGALMFRKADTPIPVKPVPAPPDATLEDSLRSMADCLKYMSEDTLRSAATRIALLRKQHAIDAERIEELERESTARIAALEEELQEAKSKIDGTRNALRNLLGCDA